MGPSNTDLHHDRCISARVWGSVGGPCSQGLLAEGRGKPHHCSETMSGPSCNQTIGKSISFLCTDLVIQKHHSPVHQTPRGNTLSLALISGTVEDAQLHTQNHMWLQAAYISGKSNILADTVLREQVHIMNRAQPQVSDLLLMETRPGSMGHRQSASKPRGDVDLCLCLSPDLTDFQYQDLFMQCATPPFRSIPGEKGT